MVMDDVLRLQIVIGIVSVTADTTNANTNAVTSGMMVMRIITYGV